MSEKLDAPRVINSVVREAPAFRRSRSRFDHLPDDRVGQVARRWPASPFKAAPALARRRLSPTSAAPGEQRPPGLNEARASEGECFPAALPT